MSRIAKEPVTIPNGVQVDLSGGMVSVKGPKGSLEQRLHPSVVVKEDAGMIHVSPRNGTVKAKALSGTFRSLIANMVTGVSDGFVKTLLIVGTGYRAKAQNGQLDLSLGFSHPVAFQAPEGIEFEVNSEKSQLAVSVKGIDKQAVGQVAADIRSLRPPEPYKGKGIRYADEHVRRKQAKSVAG